MCGISAIYRFTEITDLDKDKLSLMNKEMYYRGPDEEGVWTDETCGLAQTRLSIIGLSNGHQPIFNEDKSLVLICNGEIYNYIELRNDLKARGHVFSTASDCETILHLYEEYGVKCLEHLRGMFAFCLYDVNKKQLFVARDRIGEKTLYYAQIQTGIVFSTELKAILKEYVDAPTLNFDALSSPIRYNYPLTQETYINQIKRLKPGCFVLVNQQGIKVDRYWKRNYSDLFEGDITEAIVNAQIIFKESVDLCFRSDVPVAVLMSGGIDSCAIAAIAKEIGREVHVITAGYKGQYSCDERSVAKRFAQEKGLVFHEVELDDSDFENLFYEYTQYIDEPICDVASMSQWALYKKAKELGYTVVLTGSGGDELFYGYPYENMQAKYISMSTQHRDLFKKRSLEIFHFIKENYKAIVSGRVYSPFQAKSMQHWVYDNYMSFAKNATLPINGSRYKFNEAALSFGFEQDFITNLDAVYQLKYDTFLANLSLYLGDRLGMGNSLEVRNPFVDYKLIEFITSLPIHLKYKDGNPKYFLKKMMVNTLPDYILNATKRGFSPPMDYLKPLIKNYSYNCIESDYKFFNSILADRVMTLQKHNLYDI